MTMRSKYGYLKILILLLTIPLLVTIAPAARFPGAGQGGTIGAQGGPGSMSPEDRLKQMIKDFDLTADQQAKIKPILADQQKKLDDLKNNSSGDQQSTRGKMTNIQQDANNQIRAVLTDTQKDKFDKMEKDRQDSSKNTGGGMGGPSNNPPSPSTPATGKAPTRSPGEDPNGES